MLQTVPEAALSYSALQRAEIGAATAAVSRLWRRMGSDFDASYARVEPALLAVLFFGAYNYPGMAWAVENWGVNIANVIGILVLFIKICAFIFFFMWVRWTIPRFRYDQLMNLGWKKLIPLAIFNIIITGAAVLFLKPVITAWLN